VRMEAFEDSLVDQMDSAIGALKDLVWTKAGSRIKSLKKGHFYNQVKAIDRLEIRKINKDRMDRKKELYL